MAAQASPSHEYQYSSVLPKYSGRTEQVFLQDFTFRVGVNSVRKGMMSLSLEMSVRKEGGGEIAALFFLEWGGDSPKKDLQERI